MSLESFQVVHVLLHLLICSSQVCALLKQTHIQNVFLQNVSASLRLRTKRLLNGTLVWDFRHSYFFIKSKFLVPWFQPRLFSNINLNLPRYSILKIIARIIRIPGKKFFCQARAKHNRLFLVGLWSNCTHTYFFWSSIPLKAVKKIIIFRISKLFGFILWICEMNLYIHWEYAEWICSCIENTQKESVNIPKIQYAEWYKSSNAISLFVYWEYAQWICLYTEYKRNKF
jgi:hypothetical protein